MPLVLAAGLLGLALRTDEQRRRAPWLPAGPPHPVPATTALLPVRDEEHNVLPCLDGLLGQTAQPWVRVIDDGSRDGTAALVRQRQRDEPRLALFEAGPLAPGWRGKVHALAAGARGVDTPWLLLTDADTRHAPELLARAHAAAAGRRLDAVSIAGFQEARGIGENLLIPAAFAVLDAQLGDWAAAAEAGPAVANGQFILLRRQAWEHCGGFAPIRAVAMDDVAIAERLRAHGYRTGFLRAPDLLRVRMYRGLREAARGWRRILGALYGPRPGAAAAALAALLAVPAALAVSLIAGAWVPAALLWASGAAGSALLRAGSGHAPAWGLLFPLDALLLAWILGNSVRDHRGGRLIDWKGREMRLGPAATGQAAAQASDNADQISEAS